MVCLLAVDVRLLSRPGLPTVVIAVGYSGGSNTDNGFSTFAVNMTSYQVVHLAAFRSESVQR